MHVRLTGPPLPLWVCARRLSTHGFAPLSSPDALLDSRHEAERYSLRLSGPSDLHVPGRGGDLECDISWFGPASDGPPGSEAVVQALCGIMHVHGLEAGRPRRLGLEIASVASGVLAAQGVLAAVLARVTGGDVSKAATSVLGAGLMAMSQYIARATCSQRWGDWVPVPRASGPGAPFPSAEGRWFEVEILDPGLWKDFWSALGVEGAALGPGWVLFSARYSTAIGSLPPEFHRATSRHTLARVSEVADALGVSLAPVRDYAEVMADPGPGPVERPLFHGSTQEATQTARAARRHPPVALPLQGVVVIEATSRIQGPLAGLLLRLLGARVIRVEPPGGDVGRMAPPSAGDVGAFFLSVNRGKEVVELDLGTLSGRRELSDLLAAADVFLHNWRPGKAAEWRLGWDDVVSRNPGLVYCAASGWGPAAGSCPSIGTEFLVQAYAGLGEGLRPDGELGLPCRVLLVDFMGGLLAGEAVLGGLLGRQVTGRGLSVESSLLAGAMALQAHVLTMAATGREDGRKGGRPVWGPLDHPVPTSEGWVAITACGDHARRRLARMCGASPDGRSVLDPSALAECLGRRPADEWERRLQAAAIPAARVRTDLGGLGDDPRLARLLEPLGDLSAVPRSPWAFS